MVFKVVFSGGFKVYKVVLCFFKVALRFFKVVLWFLRCF